MKSATRSKSTVRLGVESLESRLTPAGNVTAIFDPETSTITITGDALDNTVSVYIDSQNFSPGVTTVWGNDLETTINGSSSVVFWDLRSKIVFDGGGGNDVLSITNDSYWSGDVDFQGGDGDDVLWIGRVGSLGNLTIDGGRGNDYIDLACDLLGNLTVSTGDGKDRLLLHSMAVSGNVAVDMGKGNDTVTIDTGFTALGTMSFVGGAGRDTISLPADILGIANLEQFEVISST